MRAWVTHGYGDMRLAEVPEPSVRPGWVKARIRVAQPSITEILLFHGERTYAHELIARQLAQGPAQLFGHEFTAEIVEIGAGVTSLAPGDRVTARGSHRDGIVGFDYPGAFAEYGVFPETLFCKLPAHVDDSEGAAIQPLTDCVAAVHAAAIQPNETVVVIGLGAMGLGCLQVARAAGAARIVGIARRAPVLALAHALGATHTINAAADDPVAAVRKLTAGRGADVVFETAGGPAARGLAGNTTLIQAGRMARSEGRIVGVAFDGDAAVLPYDVFRVRSLRFQFPAVLTRALFERTVELVASGQVRLAPLITHVLSGLESLPEAFALTANKAAHGLINPAQIVVHR